MEFTGERYLPELDAAEIGYEHWHRYLFASPFVQGKTVLDIACGEGYGSFYLSSLAKHVVGVDISQEAIDYAASKYIKHNLEFKTGAASKIPIKDESVFDVVVSFETIEHMAEADQSLFLAEVKRLLKPNGVFLVSTPNKLVYSDLTGHKNEFHFREFFVPEFKEFLFARFKYADFFGQKIEVGSYISRLDHKRGNSTEYNISFTEQGFRPTNEPRDQVYLLAVCSDEPVIETGPSFAMDRSYRIVSKREWQIQNLTNQVHENEQVVQQLSNQITALEKSREVQFQSLSAQIAERDQTIQALYTQIAERDQTIQSLSGQVAERDQTIQSLSGQVAERERTVQTLSTQFESEVGRITDALHRIIGERDELTRRLLEREQQVAAIQKSTSWKLMMRAGRVKEWLFPTGGFRGRLFLLARNGVYVWHREGFVSFARRVYHKMMKDLYRENMNTSRVGSADSAVSRVNAEPAEGNPSPRDAVPLSSDLLYDFSKYRRVYLDMLDPSVQRQDEFYVSIRADDVVTNDLSPKLIAFYLPQYHPIPENDEWWGKGFTEWTNVSKAKPNFIGHYQPRLPGELGFYDLRVPDVQKRQVELAQKYGVYGFCFYYYWFNGKRLLEHPLDQFLTNEELDFPFCICWANENWSRRWDGSEQDVLLRQVHSEEADVHFIQDISKIFLDKRYIRVEDKPLLVVYNLDILPDPQKTAEIWRSECHKMGLGEIYLVAVQSFASLGDPRLYGFDAMLEFPPHHLGNALVDRTTLQVTNPAFTGEVFDYRSAAQISMDRPVPDYIYFKTVMPAWDNTARRQNTSHIFVNSSPEAYRDWLQKAVKYTRLHLPKDKRFVFINAWNEWAEGTYLEPDRKYGYAYLQATADAIQEGTGKKFPFPPGWKILFVSHDANQAGAQAALFSTLEWFREHTSISLKVLCLEGGPLLPRFEALADTVTLDELRGASEINSKEWMERLLDFCDGKPDLIYGNTVVAGKAYQWLDALEVPILTHVYELEMSIQRYAAQWIGDVLRYSAHYITPSNAVKDNLVKNHAVDPSKITVVYGAVSNEPLQLYESVNEKREARRKLGLDAEKLMVVGCGLGMPFRKGADLFIELGDLLRRQGRSDVHFYWIGDFDNLESDPVYGTWADHQMRLTKNNLGDFVTFLGYKKNFRDYFQAADIFVLPSREDPLPLVALEAAKCGLPLVCFADAGGTPDLVGEDAGFVVPFEDTAILAEKIVRLIDDPSLRTAMGTRAREKFLSQFTVERTTPHILLTCRKVTAQKPAVSVIVPNYNHANYLQERLESIFNQTFQDFEVILLDDASTDNSMEVLLRYAGYGDVRIHKNDRNSGSPFKQWLLGLEMAQADIIWIAESDDICQPGFLEHLLPAFRDPAVKLAYANSTVIDEHGDVIGDYSSDSVEYLTALSPTKWKSSYVTTANQEINEALGIKNTLLNVSAVLFRKFEMPPEVKEALEKMRIAGDWYLYVHAIKDGKVYYDFRKWNSHRRHSSSVIAQAVSENKIQNFFREFSLVHTYVFSTYRLDPGFQEKWEKDLLRQLSNFPLEATKETLKRYYPLDELQALIGEAQSSPEAKEIISLQST